MLLITRGAGESIIIYDKENDEYVTVYVRGVKQGQANIGITASKKFVIHREEIWNKMAGIDSKKKDL